MSRSPARTRGTLRCVAFTLALLSAAFCAPVYAQLTTATLQGTVSDQGGVIPGATVVAREASSGFEYRAVSGDDGTYTLAGLRPGTYEVVASLDTLKSSPQRVQVLVGQTSRLDLNVAPTLTETVDVVAEQRIVDVRAPEIGTSVTQDQLRILPQNSRNFLNFAALAPGVRVSTDEFRQEITAGALAARDTNVFIDGVSLKSDLLEGGVVGQDASRGNPFPQGAVQEFRVLSQNYKAEFEKASSAIITAVTRSGGNRWSGDAFTFYQDKHLVELDEFARQRDLPKPEYSRFQSGGAIGGPLVANRAQVFASYEQNRQNRDSQVFLGNRSVSGPPALIESLRRYEGTFTSPFREHLLFTKLSAQPRQDHTLELTYSLRNETDVRGFGNDTSYEAAENVRNRVDTVNGRYQVARPGWLNEAIVSYLRYRWNPTPLDTSQPGLTYQGILRIGGRDSEQFFVQERIALRDNFSVFVNAAGNHSLKTGGVLTFARYDVSKRLNANPQFTFLPDISYDFPAEARYGAGDPALDADNLQAGLYIQDDWAITSRLTLNLGLRWDYESDMLNNDYVTPQAVREATAPFVDAARYFSDGDDRPAFYGAIQPRVGATYDLLGTGRTVLFGGYGRYYDRVLYNYTLDERFRQQWAIRTFRFSTTGEPRDGNPTLVWDPAYFSQAGLEAVIGAGRAPNPEVFLIDNETRPPVSDQVTAGIRQSVAGIQFSASYGGVRSRNGFTFLFGNRRPDGTCCQPIPGYANILVSSDERRSWFDAFYLTAEKPYGVNGSRWGLTLSYTLGEATQTGGDLFSLDFPTVAGYPRYPTAGDERHRVVTSVIYRLPLDIIASSLITLGSGTPFTITDESQGTGVNQRRVLRNEGRPEQFGFIFPDAWAYRSVDVRLEKIFRVPGGQQVSFAAEAFNLFSFSNYRDFDGYIPPLPDTNPNFGRPRAVIDPGRRLQFGLRYAF